jgi:small-conductance mechanosensitive channel
VYESILNYAFYALLVFGILAVLGFDALAFGLAVAVVAIAFSVVIGSTSSAIFEGVLMILVRRPYGR